MQNHTGRLVAAALIASCLATTGCSSNSFDCADTGVLERLKADFVGEATGKAADHLRAAAFSDIQVLDVNKETGEYQCQLVVSITGLEHLYGKERSSTDIRYSVRPAEANEAGFLIFDSNASNFWQQIVHDVDRQALMDKVLADKKALVDEFSSNPIKPMPEEMAKQEIEKQIRERYPDGVDSIKIFGLDADGDQLLEYVATFVTTNPVYSTTQKQGRYYYQVAEKPGEVAHLEREYAADDWLLGGSSDEGEIDAVSVKEANNDPATRAVAVVAFAFSSGASEEREIRTSRVALASKLK